jgi:phosphohistidine phosphatase
MKVLIIRHGIAVPRGTPGIPDDERPLTQEGEKKFRRAAKGLARVVPPPDALLTSPLPRARATAEIAAGAWGWIPTQVVPALAQGDVEAVLATLSRFPADATIAIVGHEPHLSALLAELLASSEAGRLTFRKGGAALVELSDSPGAGAALLWYLPPRILRKLGTA